jgi:hypothetical protein
LGFVQGEIEQVALLPQHGGAIENTVLLQMRKALQTTEMAVFM